MEHGSHSSPKASLGLIPDISAAIYCSEQLIGARSVIQNKHVAFCAVPPQKEAHKFCKSREFCDCELCPVCGFSDKLSVTYLTQRRIYPKTNLVKQFVNCDTGFFPCAVSRQLSNTPVLALNAVICKSSWRGCFLWFGRLFSEYGFF